MSHSNQAVSPFSSLPANGFLLLIVCNPHFLPWPTWPYVTWPLWPNFLSLLPSYLSGLHRCSSSRVLLLQWLGILNAPPSDTHLVPSLPVQFSSLCTCHHCRKFFPDTCHSPTPYPALFFFIVYHSSNKQYSLIYYFVHAAFPSWISAPRGASSLLFTALSPVTRIVPGQ